MALNRTDIIPGKPEKAIDYELGDGKYGRVIWTIQSNDGQTMKVEVQAFEVDEMGFFMVAPSGAPSRTAGQVTEVHLSGCLGTLPTQTLKAGWVFQPMTIDPLNPPSHDVAGEGTPTVETVPGSDGKFYWDTLNHRLWKWHPGALESVVHDKAVELQSLIANSSLLTNFTL